MPWPVEPRGNTVELGCMRRIANPHPVEHISVVLSLDGLQRQYTCQVHDALRCGCGVQR